MKLYLSPGACSLSPHIVLHEAGLAHDTERVDLRAKTTSSGANFKEINPKGQVPTLQLDDGEILTEGAVIVQYLADLAPGTELAPPAGTRERYRLQEWLNYIAAEVHKSYSPLFRPLSDEQGAAARAHILTRVAHIDTVLADRTWLMGDTFTVADAYLFTVLNWSGMAKVDLSPYTNVTAYLGRVVERPSVQKALVAEGLA
jgi:glutathione S-transferase